MILVCDAYRKDLLHANEFVRGSTLRFLCKLKEPELLEPLMPAIRDCLSYRHPCAGNPLFFFFLSFHCLFFLASSLFLASYVKRNAVLAIYTIYKAFDHLIPDAPELIEQFLETEQNASCKRNAFIMLMSVDQSRALRYLDSCLDQVRMCVYMYKPAVVVLMCALACRMP
jgi:coatomer subunit beta